MEAKLHAEQAQMESKIKTEKAKIQATNAALEADLDLLATKGEAAAALHSLMESTVDHTDTLSCSLPKLQ
jgi:hypothetical protein